jgi:CheY-specific phosphatase CheX
MSIGSKLELIFSDVLTEIISTISGFSLEVLSQEEDKCFEDMVGVMSLNGENNITFFVSAKETDMRILCSYMTGIPQAEVTKNDTEDALCELVNMAGGSAKLRLGGSDYLYTLSPPFALRGQNMSIVAKNKTHVISRVLGNGEISVKLKLVH